MEITLKMTEEGIDALVKRLHIFSSCALYINIEVLVAETPDHHWVVLTIAISGEHVYSVSLLVMKSSKKCREHL